ncbi:putative nuclease HARBI1 [Bradysia coprophila]|uniref:putative nuclease HARBI1 n=1 Tax=Bradysia coprophila TaxID=38358 RepID=UPI00187DC349|nr:putative nuclease HARBI1 [Bradysia coprophila]
MDGSPCPGIPMTIQFGSVLNFYASGSYQRRVGSDAFAMMSQSLVSKCVRAFSYVITTEIMDDFVKFPQTADEIKILHDELQQRFDYPGAFAFVDGSLIGLAAVSHLIEQVHVCRKSFHAINTQFVCDVSMRFLSANARYPGSCHDALIWRASLVNSTLRRICNEMGEDWCYYLLADNGYPLQKWLLKPYDSPNTTQQQLYNKKHGKLRSLVERAIGLLKARFRCLLLERKLRYDPVMSGYIIYANACTVLHNYLIGNNFPVDEIDPIFEDYVIDSEQLEDIEISYDDLQGGVEMRNEVAQYFMGNSV